MAEKSKGLRAVLQPGMRPIKRKEQAEPERDFAPPPPHRVMWVIVDQKDKTHFEKAYAQTAYRAYELSGIQREGRRLCYSEVEVSESESLTHALWRDMLFDFLIALHVKKPTKSSKLNGHSGLNGKARKI